MNHPSRICACAIVIVTTWLILIPQATAQILSFSTALGFPDDVVTITATFDPKGARVSALQGDLNFNLTAFSARRCSLGPAITGKSLATNLIQPNVERFLVFGLNQGLIPNGVLFTCEFLILPGGSTSRLSVSALSATDPQGNGVRLMFDAGSIVVLSASAKTNASGQCNVNTCRNPITSCETVHGCGGLSGGAAASCRKDCRDGVIAACQANRSLSLCD